jgi:hypothetical protein
MFNEQSKAENEVLETMKIETETANADKLYYTKNALKWRGWTDAMIRDWLGQADLWREPSCGFMTYQYFYLDSRVEAIEKTKAFKERKQTNAERKERRRAKAAN